jgi:hypothetical protein
MSREWATYLHEAVESGKLTHDEANYMADAAVEPTGPELEEGQEYSQTMMRERKPLPLPPK